MKIENARIKKLRAEQAKVTGKISEFQQRAKEIAAQITELENLEIVQLVRNETLSPEDMLRCIAALRQGEAVHENRPD